eukprot:1764536-Amphidinium_carterae.2
MEQSSTVSDHGIHPGQSHRIRRTLWIKGQSDLDQSVQLIPGVQAWTRWRRESGQSVQSMSLSSFWTQVQQTARIRMEPRFGYTDEETQWISQCSQDSVDSWGAGRLPTQQSAHLSQSQVEDQWISQCSHPFDSRGAGRLPTELSARLSQGIRFRAKVVRIMDSVFVSHIDLWTTRSVGTVPSQL